MKRAAVGAVYLLLCVGLAIAVAGVPRLGQRPREQAVVAVAVTTTSVSSTTSTAPASTTTMPAARPPAEVKVRVYNGSRTGGAAVAVGKRLEAKGYDVLQPGPSPAKPLDATEIFYVDGWAAEAQRLASDLGGVSSIRRIESTPPMPSVGTATVLVLVAEDVVQRDH